MFDGDPHEITDYEMLQCYKAENRQLRQENAMLLATLELVHDFYTLDTQVFVSKHGLNVTSRQVHDAARAALLQAVVDEKEEVA